MKTIQLTKGKVTIVDDADYVWLSRWSWQLNSRGYAARTFRDNGRQYTMRLHRLILNPLPGFEVDHINGDPLDNRRVNLRVVTHQENMMNRRVGAADTGLKGVSKERHRWKAYIKIRGKKTHLGSFPTAARAAAAYNAAALKHFGAFARLNPIPESHEVDDETG
jgi:HNH endonuclease